MKDKHTNQNQDVRLLENEQAKIQWFETRYWLGLVFVGVVPVDKI
jgi:hypothetical protein